MTVKINIISGFIGSGKTTLINKYINEISDEKVAFLLGETGEVEIDAKDEDIFIIEDPQQEDYVPYVKKIMKKAIHDRIIIEFNSLHNLEKLIVDLEDLISENIKVSTKISVVDGSKFGFLANSIPSIVEHIHRSDLVFLNQIEDKALIKELENKVKTIKRGLTVSNSKEELSYVATIKKYDKSLSYKSLNLTFISFCLIAFGILFRLINTLDNTSVNYAQTFTTIFTGILVEALPFIMIGLFVSSILHVVIPSELILKIFPKNKFLAIIVASLAGLFFPVCDCAVIPVARRLIKKGVDVPVAITYMIASPIVDPVVIMATLYAFAGDIRFAALRVFLGLLVAIIIGNIMLATKENQSIVIDSLTPQTCDCGFCSEDELEEAPSKIRGVFRHVETEFFSIMKFIIIGAAVSGLIHTYIPQSFLINLSENQILSVIILMIAAYLMSMCATSDAFVGRSFINAFGMLPVTGFLVFGPIMDLKNTLVMSSMYTKRFVLKVVIATFIATLALILTVAPRLL